MKLVKTSAREKAYWILKKLGGLRKRKKLHNKRKMGREFCESQRGEIPLPITTKETFKGKKKRVAGKEGTLNPERSPKQKSSLNQKTKLI